MLRPPEDPDRERTSRQHRKAGHSGVSVHSAFHGGIESHAGLQFPVQTDVVQQASSGAVPVNPAHHDIILLKGAPGFGKSAAAKCLARHVPSGVRIEVDDLRKMVIGVKWTDQAEHRTVLMLGAQLAAGFLRSGFAPVILVDTFSGDKVDGFLNALRPVGCPVVPRRVPQVPRSQLAPRHRISQGRLGVFAPGSQELRDDPAVLRLALRRAIRPQVHVPAAQSHHGAATPTVQAIGWDTVGFPRHRAGCQFQHKRSVPFVKGFLVRTAHTGRLPEVPASEGFIESRGDRI